MARYGQPTNATVSTNTAAKVLVQKPGEPPAVLSLQDFLDHWAGKLIFLTSRASFIGEMAKFCHCPSHGQ